MVKITRKAKKSRKSRKIQKGEYKKRGLTQKHPKLNKNPKMNLTIMSNTRNELCKKNNFTVCCPHMPPDNKKRYVATNEKTILKYKGKNYELHTCCLMCSQSMNKLAKNVKKFNKLHIPIIKNGYLYLANKHTGFHVQKLKQIK